MRKVAAQSYNQENSECKDGFNGTLPQLDHRIEDENTDTDPDTRESVLDKRKIGKSSNQPGQYSNDNQRRKNNAKVATMPPGIPFRLWPIKVAVFTAIIPGVHWPMAK